MKPSKLTQYLGILLGATYGYIFRYLSGGDSVDEVYDYFSVYTISFLWILPIVISIIPLWVGGQEILKSPWKQFFYPVLSVLLFFLMTMSRGLGIRD